MVTWVVVLPVLAAISLVTLCGYALVSQAADLLLGRKQESLDQPAARALASRMCLGH